MRTAVFVGLMCVGGAIEEIAKALGGKPPELSETSMCFVGILFLAFVLADFITVFSGE